MSIKLEKNSFVQQIFRQLPIFIGLFAGLYFVTFPIIGFHLSYFPGDYGDGRLNLYFLEHANKFFTGQVKSFWNAPFMYPEPNVIGFSDNLLGSAPIYSAFRIFGFDMFTSYQWWYVVITSLNYATTYFFLNKLFKNRYAAVLGAIVFAFSIALQSQLTHAQTFPRYAIPLAFLMAVYFWENKKPIYFFLTLFFVVYQIYCGIYLGFMLAVPIAIFFVILYFVDSENIRNRLKDKRWVRKMAGALFVNILLLFPLMYPYMQRKIAPGIHHFMGLSNSIPTPRSHFFSQEGSLFWDFLGKSGQSITAWWDHQIFAGGIATICMLVSIIFLSCQLYKSKFRYLKDSMPALLLIAGLITFLFYIRFENITAYIFIYFLPGFCSMRSITRIINIELIFFAIAVAFTVSRVLKKENLIGFLIFMLFTGILISDNYFKEGKSYRNEKQPAIERTAPLVQLMSKIPEGSVVSYEPAERDLPPFYYQIDAMLASQSCNLKTLNAYTGTSPGKYNRYWSEMNEESRNVWLANKVLSFDTLYVIESLYSYKKILVTETNDSETKDQTIEGIINYIKTDSNWMKAVQEKAINRNISIDSMLILDAIWIIQNDDKKR